MSSVIKVGAGLVALAVIPSLLIATPSEAKAPSPEPGTVISTTAAVGPSVLPAAGTSQAMRYRMTSVSGRVVAATGLVLLPPGRPPSAGWPFVVYGHVTTGSADSCAPSSATGTNEANEYMTRGDAIATRLLRAGVAVLRPDFEGIGVPGPHPYLIGASLATATTDMVSAARRQYPSLGRDWIAAGHSEGGVGALFTASDRQSLPSGTHLRGVVAYTPVTQIATELEVLRNLPIRVPSITDGLTALAGLIIGGASTVDPTLKSLLTRGGLSEPAQALLPHLEQRCLPGLAKADSWGGLAPASIVGPQGDRAFRRLAAVLRANDPANLSIRPGLPVRIDAGIADAVAPLPFTDALVARYRSAGTAVTCRRWAGGHPDVVKEGYAAGPSVAWMLKLLE